MAMTKMAMATTILMINVQNIRPKAGYSENISYFI
jgi:hypothetical protein